LVLWIKKMKKLAKVLNLFISPPSKNNRIKQDKITLDKNGVVGDKFYKKEIKRSILITSKHSYKLATQKNININYGELGENILIDYTSYNLQIGTKLKIGETILEITQHCTLCKNLSKIDPKLPKLLKNDRGIFAKVVKNGNITKEDEVFIF